MSRLPPLRPQEIFSPGYLEGRRIHDIMSFAGTQLRDMLPMSLPERRRIMDWFDEVRMRLLTACDHTSPAPQPLIGGEPAPDRRSAGAPEILPDSRAQLAEHQARINGRPR